MKLRDDSMIPSEPRRNPPHGALMKGRDGSMIPPEPRRNPPRGAAMKARDASLSLSSSNSLTEEKEISYQILTEPDVGGKENHQVSSHLQLTVSNLSRIWSHKFDKTMNNFRTALKEYSSDKLWQEKVDEASLHLAATLKEIQDEQSRCLIAELSRELHSSTAGVKKLALIYDKRMLLHIPQNSGYPENPSRLISIMNYLQEQNLLNRCDLFKCEEVAVEKLFQVHNIGHINDIESISSKEQEERDLMASEHCGLGDIYYSEGSGKAAFLAAGGAIKACSLVAEQRYQYSFAIIRPPGHHAGLKGPAGFCLFNNVAIATSSLLVQHKMKKIMIIDWDVHHGNGTQEIFYKDERVLFFSVHRNEDEFYPSKEVGSVDRNGEGIGTGFNVNFCWPHDQIRDVDYLTVWEHVLIPLAEEFQPEIILISAGFDAAEGDTLGHCCVTPGGFAALLNMLMRFGPIVMVLEGGYNLRCLPKSVAACVEVLLGDTKGITRDTESLPYNTTWKTILKIREFFRKFWKVFETEISEEVYSKGVPYVKKKT